MNLSEKISIITSGLFILSEALALIPAIKANSIFQAITNLLKLLKK
jgi:hypothetical protein